MALGIAGLFFYFLPTLIAVSGNHRQWGTISIINIFFGWTFIRGVVSLVQLSLPHETSRNLRYST